MGLAVVVLGIKGKQGQVDYAMGAHVRESYEPETWKHAHELAGGSMILGGGLFVLGAVFFLAAALVGSPEWAIAMALLPVRDESIHVNLRGADSARRVLNIVDVSVGDLFEPFSDEVHFGERLGLIGPNGTGKTHLLRALSGETAPGDGEIGLGPRTSVGTFTQINDRPDFLGRCCCSMSRPTISTSNLPKR